MHITIRRCIGSAFIGGGLGILLALLVGCSTLTGEGATKVVQTTVIAAKIAACSQSEIAAWDKAGDRTETAYAELAAAIASCVQEALGSDRTPENMAAATSAGIAVALERKHFERYDSHARGMRHPSSEAINEALREGAKTQ